ncbi:MAG: tRNA (guanosine(37)-N1)-methyltransferase TrmD [Saprospiraceae bacterium]|nr:tRNA (guanosine(37)-N1)-methyltransferase TrmD [Saprospiraceae bacterium]
MRFDVISVLPELMESFFNHSIMKRAIDNKIIELNFISLREYGIGNYKQIDDYQYGAGAGMVLMPEPLANCIDELLSERKYDEIIYLTPDGELFKQKTANKLSLLQNVIMICGHYKGIDERIREKYVTLEISIGDYVLSGGELAAAVAIDAISRLIPGAMNDETSALFDSFQDDLLSPPVYTRPSNFRDMLVPDILLSGHEKKIEDWRFEQSVKRTRERRPDLLK